MGNEEKISVYWGGGTICVINVEDFAESNVVPYTDMECMNFPNSISAIFHVFLHVYSLLIQI
jgi:hypothetical protein